ncbi:MAG: glutamate--tRNA ligase, partial [Rickettsiales bacterium]
MTTITRFAPSPTGSLHLGGARTALFNWLYAKNNAGKFLLRIEDTDIERSKALYTKEICDSLKWLKLDWDDTIFYQRRNVNEHLKFANLLLHKDLAYKCYCTKDELKKEKEDAIKKKIPYKYSGKCRSIKEDLKKKFVIRVKVPKSGHIELSDKIQGMIKVKYNTIEDFLIVRSNNTPTYMLAVVVDDNTMKVTDIIRGDDHLTNTFKQIILYNLLNFKKPNFAHIPLIYGSDGSKLSKRHGAQSVLNYKQENMMPEALNNYLLRLGWGYKDKELFTRNEAISLFNLKGIGKSPSRFDAIKLKNVNANYFKNLTEEELFNRLSEVFKSYDKIKIKQLINVFKVRAENIKDIEEGLEYILNEDIAEYSAEALSLIN